MVLTVKMSTSACWIQIQVWLEINPTIPMSTTVIQKSINAIPMQLAPTRLAPSDVFVKQDIQVMVLTVRISTNVNVENIIVMLILFVWTQMGRTAVFAHRASMETAWIAMTLMNVPKTVITAVKTPNVWTHQGLTNANAIKVFMRAETLVNLTTIVCQARIVPKTQIVQN